jgi:hypothetical protein
VLLLYGKEGPHQPGPDEPQKPKGTIRCLGFVNLCDSAPFDKYEVSVDEAGVFWARPVSGAFDADTET